MISNKTISEIHDLPIEEVIGREIELKEKGADYQACCPFHEEKSPSFSVNIRKQIYKCFGCGEGGASGVSFVMAYHKMSYPEALERIASTHTIAVEHDKDTNKKALTDDEKTVRKQAELHLIAAQRRYSKGLPSSTAAMSYTKARDITEATIDHFSIGYAESGNVLQKELIKIGQLKAGVLSGILSEKEQADKSITTYDTFQDRLTFPIHNERGMLIGFGGRVIAESKYAKYINSPQTWLYDKSKVLYNLNRAIVPIRKMNGSVYLMEGYMDVVGIHPAGIPNAVAGCGTAFTMKQAKLLHRFCTETVIWYDGDSAGRAATAKAAEILLEVGQKVKVINVLGYDPDEFVKEKKKRPAPQHFLDWIYAQIHAPLTDYTLPNTIANAALFDLFKKADKEVTLHELEKELIFRSSQPIGALIPEGIKYTIDQQDADEDELEAQRQDFLNYLKRYPETIQDRWITKLSKANVWGIAKNTLLKALKSVYVIELKEQKDVLLDSDITSLPPDCDIDFYLRHRFAPKKDNTGYYFSNGKGYDTCGNCVIKPLFHVYGQDDNKRYIQICKGKSAVNILVDSVGVSSQSYMEQALIKEGPYFIMDFTKTYFIRLVQYLLEKFPKCYELKQLGYQSEGFLAFSNYVYNGQLTKYNDLGIFTHNKHNYLSPVVVEELKDQRDGDSALDKDKYFTYTESPVTISDYFKAYQDVFKEDAAYGIAYKIITLFRDICMRKANIPFLYVYGATNMGKSVFTDHILHFFFSGTDQHGKRMTQINLDNVSDFALAASIQRFQNCPIVLNELDEKSLDDKRMQAIKGTYDGIGRQKGTKEGNIITQTPTCTLVLAGQFLFTKDDNSLVNRSVIRSFPARIFTIEDRERLEHLDSYLDQGVSSLLCDMYKHRDYFKEKYDSTFIAIYKRLKDDFSKRNKKIVSRLVDNYSHIYASLQVMGKHIALPFSMDAFFDQMVEDIIEHNGIIKSSDGVQQFWDFVCFMLSSKIISRDKEIKIESCTSVEILGKENTTERKYFETPKEVIYINVKLLHIAYVQNSKGASMNSSSLKKYLSEMESFIGPCKKTTFSKGPSTSAYMFVASELPDVTDQLLASESYKQEIDKKAAEKAKEIQAAAEEEEFMNTEKKPF